MYYKNIKIMLSISNLKILKYENNWNVFLNI